GCGRERGVLRLLRRATRAWPLLYDSRGLAAERRTSRRVELRVLANAVRWTQRRARDEDQGGSGSLHRHWCRARELRWNLGSTPTGALPSDYRLCGERAR